MIRHIFVGTAHEGTSREQLEELLSAWRALPEKIPEIRCMTAGHNISPRDQRYSVALVADFDTMQDWEYYMDHAAHAAVREQLTSKLIRDDSRAAVQFIAEDA
jgi:hypothetical protein